MKKLLIGLAATAAIVTPLALATSAQAANNLSTDADCTPVAEIFAADAKTHVEYKWTPVKSSDGPTQWTTVDAPAGTPRTFVVKGANVNYFRDGTKTQTIIDTPAVQAVDGRTCVVGEPQPKVLPIPGDNNDQIYENPSEQYVPHITGHVTQGWDNGVAKITYVTDEGYAFADGSTTKDVTVNEIRRNIHWVVPFSGDPNPATCTAAGSFDVNADGVASQWRDDTFYFDDGKVTLLVDRTVPGVVNLYVFSTDGDTLLDGLDPLKWNVNADGRSATRTITLDPQLAVSYGVPTVTGYGNDGVVDFGASACGTWKVGSKTTLTEGAEFQTHGGTSTTGPVTRYRLVFTPDTGLSLPADLPGDGFKVGNSAVFHVYLPAATPPVDAVINPTSVTGNVTWQYGDVTGTANVDANVASGGSFDYTDSTGQTMHGAVAPGTLVKDGSKVIFTGTITASNVEWNIDRPFTVVVIDGDVDQIGVFVDREVDGILADVTSGNLTVN